jgi:Spy/CpxP family protein refolding chaperone
MSTEHEGNRQHFPTYTQEEVMKRLMIAAVVVALAGLLGVGAYALAGQGAPSGATAGGDRGQMGMGQGSTMGHGGLMHGRPITAMLQLKDRLGLTAEQVAKLEGLRNAYQQEAEKRFELLRARQGELHDLLAADQADLGRIESKFREVQQAVAEENLARIKAIVQAKDTLTPAQRQQFQALVEGAGMRMGEGQQGQETPAGGGCHDQPAATPTQRTKT